MSQDATAEMLKPDLDDEVSGLVHGYLSREQRPPQSIASGEVCTRYQAFADNKVFIWLHLNLNHATTEKQLTSRFPVVDFFFEEIRSGSYTTRIERQGENLFAVLNNVLFRPQDTSAETVTLWLYCSPKLVVMARFKPLRLIGRMLPRLQTLRVNTFTELLAFLLEGQEEVLEQVVHQASRHVDLIEERLLGNHVQRNRANLARLRRVFLRFQWLLAPGPAVMFRLFNRPPAWMDRAVMQASRQFTEEFNVMLNDLSGLIKRISLLQEEIGARQLEQSNRTLCTLTVITILALPINIVAGFFGTNIGGILLVNNHHGLILLVAIIVTFTLGAGYLALRRRDDLQIARRIS